VNARKLLVLVLLVFVAVSLGAAIWRQVRPRPDGDSHGPADIAVAQDKTIVYYMHATFRCVACNAVESAGQQVVQSEFSDDVKAERLEWQPVDYQENEPLAKQYNVAGNMIVVARFRNGKEVETRRLDQVMELADKPERLKAYIREGITSGVPPADLHMALWAALAAAFGFGLLTAISPCPLATNIAAVSFLSRGAAQPRKVLLAGLSYAIGRTVVYVSLGALILYVMQMPWAGGGNPGGTSSVSRFLLTYGGMVIGPALVLAGMLLLGLLSSSRSLNVAGQSLQQRAAKGGAKWAFVLGVLFALSFCPISATIFFGSMITLSTQHHSPVLLPATFGVATALPVLAFAFLIAFASGRVGKAFNRMTQIDWWLRHITGVVFILAGIYYSLTHLGLLSLRT
jgi:hypothetical protein